MIRLIASDMDGTLLNRQGKISPMNVAAIEALQRRGIHFLICTGRSYQDALVPLEETGITCSVICMNGAAVYDQTGTLLASQELSSDQVAQIYDCCVHEDVVFDFMTQRGSYTTVSKEKLFSCLDRQIFLPTASLEVLREIGQRFHFTDRAQLFHQGLEFFKMSVIHESPQVLQQIRSKLEQVEGLSVVSSSPTNLEITSLLAQKGTALLAYAKSLGVGMHEMMAIGDSENDYSMLSLKLKYTVAMENASDSIKRITRCQTRSHQQDGVAFAIEHLVLSEQASA